MMDEHQPNLDNDSRVCARDPSEIEVTPEMVSDGVRALREHMGYQGYGDARVAVQAVFEAMLRTSKRPKDDHVEAELQRLRERLTNHQWVLRPEIAAAPHDAIIGIQSQALKEQTQTLLKALEPPK